MVPSVNPFPPSSLHLYLPKLLTENTPDILDSFSIMQSVSTCLVVPSCFMMPAWLDVGQEQEGNCACVQAVWQLMTVLVQCAATCQLVLIALFWCMLTSTWGWRDYSFCWHWSEQPSSGDLVNAQKQGACLSMYFLLQSCLTLLAVGRHTLLH